MGAVSGCRCWKITPALRRPASEGKAGKPSGQTLIDDFNQLPAALKQVSTARESGFFAASIRILKLKLFVAGSPLHLIYTNYLGIRMLLFMRVGPGQTGSGG